MSGQDVGTSDVCLFEKAVEAGPDRETVRRRPSGFAPTLPRSVMDADTGRGRHTWLDPSGHHHARLAEARFEDNRRRARADAVDVEPVPSDVEQLPGRGV